MFGFAVSLLLHLLWLAHKEHSAYRDAKVKNLAGEGREFDKTLHHICTEQRVHNAIDVHKAGNYKYMAAKF